MMKGFLFYSDKGESGSVMLEGLIIVPFFIFSTAMLVNVGPILWETNLMIGVNRTAARIQTVNSYMNRCDFNLGEFTGALAEKNGLAHSWNADHESEPSSVTWNADSYAEPCYGIQCVSTLGEGEYHPDNNPNLSNDAPQINKNFIRLKLKNKKQESCKFCADGFLNKIESRVENAFYVPVSNCTS